MPNDNRLLNLSRHQYGTMRYINQETPTLEVLRIAHAGTLSSLLGSNRNYLSLSPHGPDQEKATVSLSKDGLQALRVYEEAGLNTRAHEKELTERCLRLLQLARRRKPEIGRLA